MTRPRVRALLAAVAVASTVTVIAPARASFIPREPVPCAHVGQALPPKAPAYEWQGASTATNVGVVSRASGACLHGTLYLPSPLPTEPQPAVIVLPPTGGRAATLDVQWGARALAGAGYVVLMVDPLGQGLSEPVGFPPCAPGEDENVQCFTVGGVNNIDNYVDAAISAIDWLESTNNPHRAITDVENIGATGWSQGATGASFASGIDERIDAVVGWDSLASTETGDAGSPRCPGAQEGKRPVLARVPAMAQSSDRECDEKSGGADPDLKKTAFRHFVAAGQPAMTIVARDQGHNSWGDRGNSVWHERHAFFTDAWFDLWLRDDGPALDRLIADEVLGEPMPNLLSTVFHSAISIPELGVDCPDLAERCEVTP